MTLPVLFEGFIMIHDIGHDALVAYRPVVGASTFHEAYGSFIRPTEEEARAVVARGHVNYLMGLDDDELSRLEAWEPSASVMRAAVDYRGDIHILDDGTSITAEELYASVEMDVPAALSGSVPRQVGPDDTIETDDARFAVTFLQFRLKRPDEIQLFETVVARARSGKDPEFTGSFMKWLGGEGSTVVLRDELCGPYRSMFDDRKVEGRQNNAWHDAWSGIDSSKLAYKEEFRVGSLSERRAEAQTYR